MNKKIVPLKTSFSSLIKKTPHCEGKEKLLKPQKIKDNSDEKIKKVSPKKAKPKEASIKFTNEQRKKLSHLITDFCKNEKYQRPTKNSHFIHSLFGTLCVSLYPVERDPKTISGTPQRKRVHRPTLEIEIVNGKPYARCYLTLFKRSKGNEKFKDITQKKDGSINLDGINLMNLSNPFKAVLWAEDYLKNTKDHPRGAAPVIRSFLIPLEHVSTLFAIARPLDQDRGQGQFGVHGTEDNLFKKLDPLPNSLVSFSNDEPEASDGIHFTLYDLQIYLTGSPLSLEKWAKGKINAAQHLRQGECEFDDNIKDPVTAYYNALEDSGFTSQKTKSITKNIPKNLK